MPSQLAKPTEIWVFDVTVPAETGTLTALAVAVARRLPAARHVLRQHLTALGLAGQTQPRGTFADTPLDDARALAFGLAPGAAALGAFGQDMPQACGHVAQGHAPRRLADTDAVRALLFPSEPAPAAPHPATSTYAVLDGARVFGLPELLEGSGLAYLSLFTGKAAIDYADTAPHLVRLRADHALTGRLLTAGVQDDPLGWDAGPGLMIRTPLSLTGLQRQLRGFTFVHDPATNKRFYYRFYDPRIFAATILHAEPQVQAKFMRGITAIALAADEEGPIAFGPATEPAQLAQAS